MIRTRAFGPLAVAFLLAACTGAPTLRDRPAPSVAEAPSPSPAPSPAPSPSPSPTPPPAFSVGRAMQHVRVLSVDIGVRPGGSPGEEAAAAYVESVLRSAGYEVSRQPARRPDGGVSHNVVGRSPGADYGGGYVLVGGHYDTTVSGPGANDNASGTAVVLALAEGLAGRRVPVEFVAFGAEERQPPTGEHHIGSEAYAGALADPSALRAMVSIDMVGNGPVLLVGRFRSHPRDLQDEIAAVAEAMGVPFDRTALGDVSDHTPFARRGIPAAWLWSGNHPTLHTAADTFEIVQPEAVERTGGVVLEWLRRRFGL